MGQHKIDHIKPKYEKSIKPIKRIFCKVCEYTLLRVPQGYYNIPVTGTCSYCLVRERNKKNVG